MIKINNASKTFNKGKQGEFKALKNISLNVNKGDFLSVIGKSGAGKSTLLHIIACIDSFDEGADFLLNGIDVTSLTDKKKGELRNKNIGLVFQDFNLVSDFSVSENVEIPLMISKFSKKQRRIAVGNMLKKVGLSGFEEKDVNKLSGGEKQRVAIARALINNPDIILADEPTGALDSKTGNEIFKLLAELNKEGKTVIIITHDMDLALKCNRLVEIADGEIIKDEYLN